MFLTVSRWSLIGLCLTIAGCIYTDRSEEYQNAASLPVIILPEDVNSAPLEPLYPIPEIAPREEAFVESGLGGDRVPRPEAMSAEREAAKVKIQKVGNRRWILVEAPASQVWPLAQSYLSEVGITVASSDAASGLIETDWLQFKDDPGTETHYRIRIEKGVRPESTEVHVLHDQATAGGQREQQWPEASADAERESWLLEGMANSLAQGIGNNSASLLGQAVGGQAKAELRIIAGEPLIWLGLDENRTWATLAYGLQQEGFILWADDESRDLFYFQYTGDYKKPNWFVRLFVWSSNKPVTEAPYSLPEVIGHLADQASVREQFDDIEGAAFGDPLPHTAGYLLVVKAVADGHQVYLRDARGQRVPSDKAKRILAALRRNLI